MVAERWPALTIRQPWEWAVEHGKPVENRSWEIKYRGPLWLHAGARSRWDPAGALFPLVRSAWEQHVRRIPGWPGLPSSDVEIGRKTTLMPFGAVAALAELVSCHHANRGRPVPSGTPCSPWSVRWPSRSRAGGCSACGVSRRT